tara:strand:+ start:2770 stop:2937 length:168 start_codon:yes stop_codon:yes gene_type:complete
MDKKIIGDNGEVQEIPLIKKAIKLFLWYLVGRYGGVLLIFTILAIIGGASEPVQW